MHCAALASRTARKSLRFLLADFRFFNSLLRVLFIFPSRYFCAIGFLLYLALDETYHPSSRCNPKQRNSLNANACGLCAARACHPLRGAVPGASRAPPAGSVVPHIELAFFRDELFPIRSPLLRESFLVSFPPLSYMLKFGGSSYVVQVCAGSAAAHPSLSSAPDCRDLPEARAIQTARTRTAFAAVLKDAEPRTSAPRAGRNSLHSEFYRSRIHFTALIAHCCVLHRCRNLDIRRRGFTINIRSKY